MGGTRGSASDINIQAQEILKLKAKLNEIFAKHTGQPLKRIEQDSDRDYFMSPIESKEYGIVDGVIEGKADVITKSKTKDKDKK